MTEKRMSFFSHLGELRSRVTVIAVVLVVLSAIAYPFSFTIFGLLIRNLPKVSLTYKSVMEPFMIKFKISVLAAFAASTPLIFYEVLAFLSPALQRKEKRLLYPLVVVMAALFLGGAAFSYYLVMPTGVKWLLGQDEGFLFELISAGDFLNFIILFLVAFGVAFETPLLVYVLMRLGIVQYSTLRQNWRIAYIVIFVTAAIATPDWSIPPMLMLAGAMIVLYELTMLLVRFTIVRKKE